MALFTEHLSLCHKLSFLIPTYSDITPKLLYDKTWHPFCFQDNSQKEIEESWAVYAELQRLLEQSQAELLELITTRQKQAEQQAKDLASGLEHELNTLKKRSSELDALAQTQDRVLFLQVSVHCHSKWHKQTSVCISALFKLFLIFFFAVPPISSSSTGAVWLVSGVCKHGSVPQHHQEVRLLSGGQIPTWGQTALWERWKTVSSLSS